MKDRFADIDMKYIMKHELTSRFGTLINMGASPNTQDKKGRTPLIIAVQRKDFNAVRAVLLNNPDKDIKDNEGLTALDYALKSGRNYLIDLIEGKCNV